MKNDLEAKYSTVAVLGLGYVGLPLAVLAAEKGFIVNGGDTSDRKIETLKSGKNPLPDLEEINESELSNFVALGKMRFSSPEIAARNAAIKIICVPTPMFEDKSPNLEFVKSVAKTISESLKKGDVVINESTVYPGVTGGILREILEKGSGLKAGEGFRLIASPERADPGNKMQITREIPKVVGGFDQKSLEFGIRFYSKMIKTVVPVSSLDAAEACKVLENSYRALNIGFINEFAMFCFEKNLDVLEILEAAKTKWSFHAHYPGIGVGGHCIPKDPYYLMDVGKKLGIEFNSLTSAVKSSEQMPSYTVKLLKKLAGEKNLRLDKIRICLFGIAYKGNVRDLRDSPAIKVHNILKEAKCDISVFDPMFTDDEIRGLGFRPYDKARGADIVIIGTDHDAFREFDFSKVPLLAGIIDGRNILKKTIVDVYGIGRKLPK
ncbi:nucleotide sugar dehydrogenase [Candidatus Micrarchaeota archaeon]|nr:nucleotide sugar dehydrogenase [Candidatus Micrarchaeota archaeon]